MTNRAEQNWPEEDVVEVSDNADTNQLFQDVAIAIMHLRNGLTHNRRAFVAVNKLSGKLGEIRTITVEPTR